MISKSKKLLIFTLIIFMNKKIVLSAFLGFAILLGLFAVGTPASAITCDSATLSGFVVTNGNSTRARFTYGTNFNIVSSGGGTPTTVQTFNSDSFVYQLISNLSGNTTYYYRLEVTSDFGTDYGNVNSFTTPACQTSNPPSVSISADQTSIQYNGSTVVRWSSNNATSCSASGGANGWSGGKSLSGSFNTGTLTNDATFSISCSNSDGSDSDSVTVDVGSQQILVPTVELKANGQLNGKGGSLTLTTGENLSLTWNSTNANSCNLSGWGGVPTTSGLITFTPSHANYPSPSGTTYTLTCTSSDGGSDSDNVFIRAAQTLSLPSVSISADQTNISYNGSTTVRWNSNNATSCSASGGANNWSGLKNISGSFFTGQLTSNTTFNITCNNNDGSDNDSVTVNVGSQQILPPTVNLQINGSHSPASINSGNAAQVTWTAQPSTSATLSCTGSGGMGIWPGGKPLSGLAIFYPTQSTTFTITCTDAVTRLNDTDSVSINVNQTPRHPRHVRTQAQLITAGCCHADILHLLLKLAKIQAP